MKQIFCFNGLYRHKGHKMTQGKQLLSSYAIKAICAVFVLFVAEKTCAQAQDMPARLESSLQELARVREAIAKEKLPMVKGLNSLEDELTDVRQQYQQVQRQLDSRNLDLNNLRSEIKSRQGDAAGSGKQQSFRRAGLCPADSVGGKLHQAPAGGRGRGHV